MSLKDLVEERFQRLLVTSLGLSVEELKRPGEALRAKPPAPVGEVVDYLSLFEASVAAALMERMGLRESADYALLPEGVGERFMLILKRGVGGEVLEALDRLRRLSQAKPIALRVLKEWRASHGEQVGDVDEAIHLALRIVEVREKLSMNRCPRCGGATAKVVERLRRGAYEVFVEHTCCGYAEHAWFPLARPGRCSKTLANRGRDK